MNLAPIEKYGKMALGGFVANSAPKIAKGMINEYLRMSKLDVKQVIALVQEDKSLWSVLPSDALDNIAIAGRRLNDVSWFDTDWLIDAIRNDHPTISSLFLGWEEARQWLEKQVEILHNKLEEE